MASPLVGNWSSPVRCPMQPAAKRRAAQPIARRFGHRHAEHVACRTVERSERTVGIIGWIVLGLVAGAIAKAILPGDDPGGIIVTMLIGIVGAIIGGLIASALDIGDLDEFFDIGTWVIAILGSLLLLVISRMVVGRDTTGHTRAT